MLDWQIAKSEGYQEWEVLVQSLWDHGCCPEQGLQLVVRDGSGGLGEALALVYGSTVREQGCLVQFQVGLYPSPPSWELSNREKTVLLHTSYGDMPKAYLVVVTYASLHCGLSTKRPWMIGI